MSPAIKITMLASGVFLLTALLVGVLKYHKIMTSPDHQAPAYVDIAHRASLMYSFATIVMAKFLEYSPYSQTVQLWASGLPIFFFAVTIATYIKLGLTNETDNQFRERNFTTTWGMYMLIAGEIGGFAVLLFGFVQAQFF